MGPKKNTTGELLKSFHLVHTHENGYFVSKIIKTDPNYWKNTLIFRNLSYKI